MITNVGAGYYTIDELCNAMADSIAINDNYQTYMISENTQSVDLSGASDIANILKLEDLLVPGAITSEPYEDIDEFEYDADQHTIFPFLLENSLTIFQVTPFHFGFKEFCRLYISRYLSRRIYYQL